MNQMRILQMYEYICKKEQVTLEDLQLEFGVSLNTVRRDVARLIAEGKVNKMYGGVCIKDQSSGVVPYTQRTLDNESEKEYICSIAANLIDNGDTIFIDSGTTVRSLLKFLAEKQNITIITHNIHIVYDAIQYQNINVIALCGSLIRKIGCVIGNGAIRHLETMNIDKAFICASGISLDGSISNPATYESDIKKQAIRRSSRRYLLMDSSKFGKLTSNTFANAKEFDYVITETEPSLEYISYFKQNGLNCIYSISDLQGAKWNFY